MAIKGYFIDNKGKVYVVENDNFTEKQSMMPKKEVLGILENLIKDMANNVTGDESDGYQNAVQDCIDDVNRYIKCIERGE